MKIYTLTGDDGTTSLSGGRRVPKDSIRIEATGSVDELIAWFGLLRDHKENLKRREFLIYIQNQLMLCTAALAYDCENINSRKILPDTDCVSYSTRRKLTHILLSYSQMCVPQGGKSRYQVKQC
jgi:ATP:cob(I)alamin adenosyltransferase